jgi:hypothetical protein
MVMQVVGPPAAWAYMPRSRPSGLKFGSGGDVLDMLLRAGGCSATARQWILGGMVWKGCAIDLQVDGTCGHGIATWQRG